MTRRHHCWENLKYIGAKIWFSIITDKDQRGNKLLTFLLWGAPRFQLYPFSKSALQAVTISKEVKLSMGQCLATVKLQLAATQNLEYISSYVSSRMLFSYPGVPNSSQELAAMFCVLAFTSTGWRRAPGKRVGWWAIKWFWRHYWREAHPTWFRIKGFSAHNPRSPMVRGSRPASCGLKLEAIQYERIFWLVGGA